ncbi:hypothetical protein XBP1_1970008 [Xenorhabdus bovienii str. puntauvense]|uniref:Transposase n=4 Tax=Xenorhabdus bovienii TaxID=40576 RepID=A0A0B6XDZ0_XENBV|nr:hypothetical protein XBFFR1_2630010 [Xenorhabdus bovienii str. feltiae France]CDG92561.1 hypothetical protein XBFFL1_2240010 [Xenorhabdus bovienii str. feltiae Florida]CDG96186.1 hypothetical protein XBP1_1970008 [Xenorhabdus bovienii str. puntauvense]CDH03854.1 hypothetical protein XBFM1_860048 [Xenorhabdus bovienii str. feltiae Moldova]CDH24345.1 hypothetical protein XBKB1_2650005 [Xenorhabdus bovienii str. kraussei Becker Underwood]CDM91366.1 protein of unknown function [Xenorhabdus bovi
MSLGENIGYGLKMQGRPKVEIREQVMEAQCHLYQSRNPPTK